MNLKERGKKLKTDIPAVFVALRKKKHRWLQKSWQQLRSPMHCHPSI